MRDIRLESPNYILRTIVHADVSDGWTRWLEDPRASRMLNASPRRFSIEELKTYIDAFDGDRRHILGMFTKPDERLVGITTLTFNAAKDEFLVNVLTGNPGDRGKGARTETRIVLYQYLFEELGMKRAHASTLALNVDNVHSMERRGWRLVGTSKRPSVNDGSVLELKSYVLDRDTWRRIGG